MADLLEILSRAMSEYSGGAIVSTLVIAVFAYLQYMQRKKWRQHAKKLREEMADAKAAHREEKQKRIEEKQAELERANRQINEKQEDMEARTRLIELVKVLTEDE